MEQRHLGISRIEASKVALGTWAIGGWKWGGTDEKDSIEAIQTAIDNGINLIDTAPAYGQGLSEEIVGKAIAGRRDEVVLATKCGMRWGVEEGEFFFEDSKVKMYRNLKPHSIKKEVEDSLRRLKVDVIDLYQTHWTDKTTPVEDTVGALMELKTEGKIRAIGVCNGNTDLFEAFRLHGDLATTQEKYSMLDREKEEEILPYCIGHNLGFLAYSPLSLGILTGKVTPDREFEGDDLRNDHPRFTVDNRQKVLAMLDEFKLFAQGLDLTLAQLVIAWTAAQPGVSHVLVGARHADQAKENAKAGETKLTDDLCDKMTEIIDRHKPDIR